MEKCIRTIAVFQISFQEQIQVIRIIEIPIFGSVSDPFTLNQKFLAIGKFLMRISRITETRNGVCVSQRVLRSRYNQTIVRNRLTMILKANQWAIKKTSKSRRVIRIVGKHRVLYRSG